MEQTLTCSLAADESEEETLRDLLERLSQKLISWDEFKDQIGDPQSSLRIATRGELRTLLHLSILDNQIEWIEWFKKDPLLKSRRDFFGLSPIDLAKILDRKEAYKLLEQDAKERLILKYPAIASFEYLAHPVFETRKDFDEVIEWVAMAKAEDKIPSEKIWMGIYFDKQICNELHPPLEIRYINEDMGYGVFALKKIPPCAFVGEYTGIIQQRTPKQLKNKNYVLRYPVWGGKKNYCIDAEHRGNFTRFINHSSKPNLGVQSVYWRGILRMIFIALDTIEPNCQLTFDYGPLFWKHSTVKEIPNDF